VTDLTDDEVQAIFARTPTSLLPPVSRLPDGPRLTMARTATPHAIATFFSRQGREYACDLAYDTATSDRSFASALYDFDGNPSVLFRYGHMPSDWPLPLSYMARDGDNMPHCFSPLGAMLWYDRRGNEDTAQPQEAYRNDDWRVIIAMTQATAFEALWLGAERAGRYLLEVGRLRAWFDKYINGNFFIATDDDGVMLRTYEVVLQTLWRGRLYADPSGIDVATMVFGYGPDTIPEQQHAVYWSCVAAADAFAQSWKRGAWWSKRGFVTPLLRQVLEV
jgi:hypothetical protein